MVSCFVIFIYLPWFGVGLPKKSKADFIEMFHQHDYEIKFERLEVISYNEYVENVKITTFKYNRTTTAFNITFIFKKNVGSNVDIIIQSYKFASNEYRLFPIRFQLNVCDILSKNVYGFNTEAFTKCEKFTGCPFVKVKQYNICKFVPATSQFPPLVPTGKYMANADVVHGCSEIFTINYYLQIMRPFEGFLL